MKALKIFITIILLSNSILNIFSLLQIYIINFDNYILMLLVMFFTPGIFIIAIIDSVIFQNKVKYSGKNVIRETILLSDYKIKVFALVILVLCVFNVIYLALFYEESIRRVFDGYAIFNNDIYIKKINKHEFLKYNNQHISFITTTINFFNLFPFIYFYTRNILLNKYGASSDPDITKGIFRKEVFIGMLVTLVILILLFGIINLLSLYLK